MRFCLAILTLHCKIARLPPSLGPWPASRPRRSGSRCASRRRGRRARPGPPGSCRSRSRRWAGGPYPSAALIGPQTTYTHPFGTKLSVPNVLKLSSNPMGDSTDSIGVVFPSPPRNAPWDMMVLEPHVSFRFVPIPSIPNLARGSKHPRQDSSALLRIE